MSVPDVKFTAKEALMLETCVKCAACTKSCPVYRITHDPRCTPPYRSKVLRKVYQSQHGFPYKRDKPRIEELAEDFEEVFKCTLCGICTIGCTFQIQMRETLFDKLRALYEQLGLTKGGIKQTLDSIREFKNPFGLEKDLRVMWISDAESYEVQVPVKQKAKILYFVGCTSALKGALSMIPIGAAKVLNTIGEPWTVLGEEEVCCGNPALAAGGEKVAKELAEENVRLAEQLGVEVIVTTCPGCFRTWMWEFPKLLKRKPPFKVMHLTELVLNHVKSGNLKLKQVIDEVVTYHDPCELGRLSGILNEPRELLKAMAKGLREPKEAKSEGLCCGGGGLLNLVDKEAWNNLSVFRLKQLMETGAKKIFSSCPSCKNTLMSAIEAIGADVEIIDLAEVLGDAVEKA